MVKLVFAGHTNRGGEIIKLLEMLGGKNIKGFKKTFAGFYYFINENNEITPSDMPPANSMVYSLEDFEKEYPYKVGDLVRYFPHKVSVIKSMFISYDGDVKYGLEEVDDVFFQAHQLEYVGKAEYYQVNENVKSSKGVNLQQLEKQLDEALEKETTESLNKWLDEENVNTNNLCTRCVYAVDNHCGLRGFTNDFNRLYCSAQNADKLPNGFELQPDGYFSWVDSKPQYPKTYAECCKIVNASIFVSLVYNLTDGEGYSHDVDNLKIYDNIRRLKICRDAYWKIAGEKMGLDKPWDSTYGCGEWGYWIGYDINENKIYCQDSRILLNNLLVFPTKEMRDVFYENFKDLIEQCKELL